MLGFSVLLTTLVLFYNAPMLKLLGASGNMLPLAQEYIVIISFGTGLQIFGTGLVPFIRNLGGSSFAMISMVSGFATNIVFDYLFVWVWEQGMTGAAPCDCARARTDHALCPGLLVQKRPVHDEDPP